jgi:hypothetical protein
MHLGQEIDSEGEPLTPVPPPTWISKWSALGDDFRTLLVMRDGSETIFQQFMA